VTRDGGRGSHLRADQMGSAAKPLTTFKISVGRGCATFTGLKAVGIAPEQVDFVMCTHLHIDHVGWETRLGGGPRR